MKKIKRRGMQISEADEHEAAAQEISKGVIFLLGLVRAACGVELERAKDVLVDAILSVRNSREPGTYDIGLDLPFRVDHSYLPWAKR